MSFENGGGGSGAAGIRRTGAPGEPGHRLPQAGDRWRAAPVPRRWRYL